MKSKFTVITSIMFLICMEVMAQPTYELTTGKLRVPFNNKGVIANVNYGGSSGILYDGVSTIYSLGFALSGVNSGSVWSNGVMSQASVLDYLPGKIGSLPDDVKNKIYVVSINDIPFGVSWQNWRDAVSIGARFYDGNGDGVYNPVDLNNNGKWDANEDMPEILGEISAWCVYNDGVLPAFRRFSNVEPLGIEVAQTIFVYPNSAISEYKNAVFVRYEVKNTGTKSTLLDSLIFAIHSDVDLGAYFDDLTGSDVQRNASFVYNDSTDELFGNNPPAVYNSLILGTPQFIPGVTFTDVNGNGRFDTGTDIAIDTAIIVYGKPFAKSKVPGARNSLMTGATSIRGSSVPYGDATTKEELRNYLLGLTKSGVPQNPCTDSYGTVTGVNCSGVDSRFAYSGDPTTGVGWVNNSVSEKRTLTSSGIFSLAANETATFYTATVIGRGLDNFNSISVTRSAVDTIMRRLVSNGSDIPLAIDDNSKVIPSEYELKQNYPNPFNPSTVIRFTLSDESNVKLTVYNVMGEKVTDLINSTLQQGVHEVHFDASKLTSGIYFYELQTRDIKLTKKMMLVR